MACQLECRKCGAKFPEADRHVKCPVCGGRLRVKPDLEDIKKTFSQGLPSPEASFLDQWKAILPIGDESLVEEVALGEGETPLLASRRIGKELGIKNLYFKLEMGPTLSLKDRGTALCILKALEHGYGGVSIASSGNNAGSVAAYAARAGLPAIVFIQEQVSPSKVLKSIAYGAKVARVEGGMPEASKVCDEMSAANNWLNCGGSNPYRIAAKRTAGYEIVRQLGKAPDAVIMPCGGGAGIVSMYEAFEEMLELGLVDKIPRLYGIQLAACNPVEQAFIEGRNEVTPVEKKKSLSDAIMNNNPAWGNEALAIARKTGGGIYSVTDEEFVEMIRKMGKEEGLFTEPAGCISVAVLKKLKEKDPAFNECETVVCTLTGHGLNSPRVAVEEEELPPVIPATPEAAREFLNLA